MTNFVRVMLEIDVEAGLLGEAEEIVESLLGASLESSTEVLRYDIIEASKLED